MAPGRTSKHHRLWTFSSAAALLAAVAMGAGACGSGTRSASAGACDSPGVTPTQIHLGLLYPNTGPSAPGLAASRAGVDARIGLANASGGINGRKIVYEWRDDQDNPTANATAARYLVEQSKVFGILEFTAVSAGSAQYLTDRDVPVGGLSIGGAWANHPNMFTIGPTTSSAIDLFGNYVRNQGASKAFVLTTALSAISGDASTSFAASFRAAGVQIVDRSAFTAGVDDPSVIAQRVARSGADTLLLVINGNSVPTMMKAIRAGAPNLRVVLSLSGYDKQVLAQAGGAMAGVEIPLYFRPFEAGGPSIDTFRRGMTEFAPEVSDTDQQLALISYIDTDLFLRGLQAAGPCPTRASFMSGLRATSNYDAGGLITPFNIARDLHKQITCWSFVRGNASGTAFDVAGDNLCGHELPAGAGG
ncbi:ABC-type branched-chain amino acid transport system, periplasmic component [Frankia canadensis]|uniref:ABC-type branched-chain amino acid transport system, periplasmic component n=1 Tax=Frankia canadensis TaxID=1836972 RepID=A0A2I2KQM2_9ACTN|nr:ABC transporter substrate-binding protein [Frankia canadensis]SNQ47964.1 ABC-type branched-chain amino acid transport system, periplasmic component [Frankia canadensis]SOU55254.1 ABC-type branched-chain amino acid transport system, periplasmic component [Frankia canadensis]